jgi:hypothetical protein
VPLVPAEAIVAVIMGERGAMHALSSLDRVLEVPVPREMDQVGRE